MHNIVRSIFMAFSKVVAQASRELQDTAMLTLRRNPQWPSKDPDNPRTASTRTGQPLLTVHFIYAASIHN